MSSDEPRGPFDFYHAVAVEISPELREQQIQDIARAADTTRERAEEIFNLRRDVKLLKSTEYQVAIFQAPNGFDQPMLHLSIKRLDRQPIRDWRAFQNIKNAIVGDECEAIELFPAESRLVDGANQYHIWAFTDPEVRLPLGFAERMCTNDDESVAGSVQRKFEAPDALLPSKLEMIEAIRFLLPFFKNDDGQDFTRPDSDAEKDIARVRKILARAAVVYDGAENGEQS